MLQRFHVLVEFLSTRLKVLKGGPQVVGGLLIVQQYTYRVAAIVDLL